MKALKVIVALLLSFLLICGQGILMGAFACDQSLSENSITKAVKESDFAEELYNQALESSNQAADEKISAFIEQAMKTDTASRFIGEYAASTIDSVLYGKEYREFTQEDLNQLAQDSLKELSETTGVPISEKQRKEVLAYVSKNGSPLVKEINDTLPVIENNASEDTDDITNMTAVSQVRTFLGTPVRITLCAVCLILGILLIALFWGSKLGFIWWAFVSFILGSAFILLGTSSDILSSYIQNTGEGTAFSLLITGMFGQGFTFVGAAALILTAVLIILCLVARKVPGRKKAF